ncbi:MAG TPA: PD-(D/E)XK nuclease family protein, partial [Phycisphaerae bacterium]|nr:PD-(D/E)XK nuclease family protein [Phycisphaerae bacterium]
GGGVRDALLNRLDFGLTLNLKGGDEDQAEEKDGGPAPESPLSFRIAKALEEADQRREDIRKLYVAATRHQDHLVFVAADWRAADGAFRSGGSYMNMMDAQLGIAEAADTERNIPYAGGRFEAAVTKLTPAQVSGGAQSRSRGRRILKRSASAEELAAAIAREAHGPPPKLLGPIPPETGKVELAATALAEFEYCPMLYRWQHELRVPVVRAERGGVSSGAAEGLDPATLGTLYHRCMELLDFASPQKASALVAQAAGEMALAEEAHPGAVAGELEAMLAAFKRRPLWRTLAGAKQMFRELDFVLQAGPATIAGKIDMLYEDAGGAWHIVDYKSDRIGAEAVAPHGRRYGLQMLVYAAAAARHLGRPPADAIVYFLRPAAEHTFSLTGEAISGAESKIQKVASELIAARRRGRFNCSESGACKLCPYGALCRRGA